MRRFMWRELHPVVKMILLGSVLINISSGMIVPYFANYIGKYTGLSLAEIGLVIGLSSLAGMAGGFIGGTLSDLFIGQKKSHAGLVIPSCFHHARLNLLSIAISRIVEKRTPLQSVITGSLFFTVGLLGFAFSFNLVTFLFSMIVFTIGEIFLIPAEYAVIDEITPNHIRGTYYGAVSFTTMGSFFGPWLSGILLTRSNSVVMFIGFIAIMLACMLFYFWGARLRGSNEKDANSKLRVLS